MTSMTLDPAGEEDWLASELGNNFTSKCTFNPVANTPHTYLLEAQDTFWESSNVILKTVLNDQGNPAEYEFIRKRSDASTDFINIKSVSDVLTVSIAYTAGGKPFASSILRSFQASLVIADRELNIWLTPIGYDQLELLCKTDQGPSLGDVFKLLGYASTSQKDIRSDLTWLPDELRTGSILQITDFHTVLRHKSTGNEEPVALPGERTGGCDIVNIGVGLSFLNDHSWDLIPGQHALKAGQITARLDVAYPLNSEHRFPRIDVGAVITISASGHPDARIDLSARWPDYSVSAILQQGNSIPLGALLQQLGVPAGKVGETLIIDDLALEAEPAFTPRSFLMSLGVGNLGEWDFPLWGSTKLAFERLNVSVEYRGGDAGYLNGRLFGQLVIGSIELSASAEASNAGWAFSGSVSSTDKLRDWLPKVGRDTTGLPDALLDFSISDIALSFHTADSDVTFEIDCSTTWNQIELQARLMLHYSRQDGGKDYQFQAQGHISLGKRQFDLVFDKTAQTATLLAVYASPDKDQFDLGSVLRDLCGFDSKLNIFLSSVELALDSSDKKLVLVGVDMGGTINLAKLPLVGSILTGDQSVSMSLQALYCSDPKAEGTAGLINALQSLLPSGSLALPTKDKIQSFNLTPTLQIGTERFQLNLPIKIDSGGDIKSTGDAAAPVAPSSDSNAQDAGGVSWFPIQKQFGPVYLSRIGGRYQQGAAQFLLDATLQLGPLTFSLDGLSVSTALTGKNIPFSLDPKFSLSGLGLGVAAGPLAISGTFIHDAVTDDYSGTASLSFKELTLSAIGSYTEIRGQKSLFLYAILNYPLGGPSFFFVEGLAAGFGYNRAFIPPPLQQVHEFPLIVEAATGGRMPAKVSDEIQKLSSFIPARPDQYFLIAGIKFNSFKLIDSVALVAVSFGSHFEVDVLGYSHFELPRQDDTQKAKVAPLVVIDMELKAVVNPDAGIISVEADLTPTSHLFSDACRITGGFAFYSWISGEHAGDFVVTLGGYHPSFIPPAHYPTPDRVALNWQYNDSLQIKGDLYFALTPSAVMAGGHLEVTYHEGSIRAWLRAGADFLMLWKPYHYDAHMYVNIGGSADVDFFFFTGTVTIDIGADLHLWGPDLAGTATINLYLFSFDISFGAGPSAPQPIHWTDFKSSFIPEKSQLTVTIADGLVETIDQRPIVNPQRLRLVTDSFVPIKHLQLGDSPGQDVSPASWRRVGMDDNTQTTLAPNTEFSVAPMGISASQFSTIHGITISKGGTEVAFKDHFEVTGLLKSQPKSLWEDRSQKDKTKLSASELSAEMMLDRLCSGLEIKAKPSPTSKPVDLKLIPKIEPLSSGGWRSAQRLPQIAATLDSRSLIAQDILKPGTIHQRTQLMKDFGLEVESLDFPGSFTQDFRVAPVIDRFGAAK